MMRMISKGLQQSNISKFTGLFRALSAIASNSTSTELNAHLQHSTSTVSGIIKKGLLSSASSSGNFDARRSYHIGVYCTKLLGSPKPLESLLHYRNMRVGANELRPGMIYESKGRLVQVTKATHTHGRARASGNVQVELKELQSGAKGGSERFDPSEIITLATLDLKSFQYLYTEENVIYLMDPESFEQVEVSMDLMSKDQLQWVSETIVVTLGYVDGEMVSVTIPEKVEMLVAEAAVKSINADGRGSKSAVLVNGLNITVPGFVEAGDTVIMDTRDGTFVKRVRM
ncbi:hypothetical protein CYMTET_19613 [Cymbomonas tetramitiformis]|uniref:Elongation factor P n=1 Tax=Cymbomonas tetramitiformis TaxID=36881 RepID=A0AAE0G693_9CHLO|nr:hypothetical protein CYMTET_19613 [Cymbomonas tetramitiformis]